MADVFISYAQEDREQAARLASQINDIGLSVWWDRALLPADKWDEAIERELDAAKAVLVIWSKNSVNNPNVRDEAHEARAQDKLAPVAFGECRPPLFFRRHQYEDLTEWSGAPEALSFQRLAIQLVAFSRGQQQADLLPLDGETPPRLDPIAEKQEEAVSALRRWAGFGFAIAVLVGVIAYVRGYDLLDDLGPYNATLLVLAGAAIGLFRAAEIAMPAGPKALVARWLAGERSYSSAQAFLTMFEAVFGKNHWTISCFWRSATATLFVYVVLLALFVDFDRLTAQVAAEGAFAPKFEGANYELKKKLEESALLLLIIVPLTNIFADYVSLWETRKILQWSTGRLPLWLGVLLDAVLTAAVFLALLPIGPMISIYAAAGKDYAAFSPQAWEAAVAFVPEVWRGFWMIFEGHPLAEIDAALSAEASLSTTTLLIAFATTFITSVWLWLALLAAPFFWLMSAGRRQGASWLARATGATKRPIQSLGYGAAAAVMALGLGGEALAGLIAESRSHKPFRDCEGCPWMVNLKGGTFMMGTPMDAPGRIQYDGPHYEVTIEPFAIGIFEVNYRNWSACVADGFCQKNPKPNDYGWGRGWRPAIGVARDDMLGEGGFIAWLNSKSLEADYRIPTEAEWEYAARGGTTTVYSTGDAITHKQANFTAGGGNWISGKSETDFAGRTRGQTLPVGAFAPNPFGLYDVHGNVFETVRNCSVKDTGENIPIVAPKEAQEYDCSKARESANFGIRGGSWRGGPQTLRSSNRDSIGANGTNQTGYRVVRTPRRN